MARKGNQMKNRLDSRLRNSKKLVPDSASALANGIDGNNSSEAKVFEIELLNNGLPSHPLAQNLNGIHHIEGEKNTRHSVKESLLREGHGVIDSRAEEQISSSLDCNTNIPTVETAESAGVERPCYTSQDLKNTNLGPGPSIMGSFRDVMMEKVEFSVTAVSTHLRSFALFISEASNEWVVEHRPWFDALANSISNAQGYVRVKFDQACSVTFRWIKHLGSLMFLLSMVWLECTLRGIDSLLRMGTASIFSIFWWGLLSVMAITGVFKFLLIMVAAFVVGLLVGFTISVLLPAAACVAFVWFYGRFWVTTLFLLIGGTTFMLRHERFALLGLTLYSVHCARSYLGWLGLFLGLNLSFISSDLLVFFLQYNVNEQRRPTPQGTAEMPGQEGFFSFESVNTYAESFPDSSADRSSGQPSTSGSDVNMTPEDEILRLMNCTDHYSVLGLSRFDNVDMPVLKREYKKKAMLVHPDKNMGNDRAAEAFKKLQNAYETLLDSSKQKAYDDELSRDELLNYFRRFQNASPQSRGAGLFSSIFTGTDSEDPLGESRRIACRSCGNFHVWVCTKKSKSKARWCQDCKELHSAKDGDGWVEKSSQPFFFGILQKVADPSAFVCANGKVYDATDWYICQGMRCPANTHKPSFHVNTNVTTKHNNGKRTSSGQRGGARPGPDFEETMTEEEFVEWLQNAVQAGIFNNFPGATSDSAPAQSANTSKSSGTTNGGSSNKKKKKGKKQW